MVLLVQGQLPGLLEALVTAFKRALEWFLTRVDISVFLQVLSESEPLQTDHTHELFCWRVCSQVSSQWESGCEHFVTAFMVAFIRSLHLKYWFLILKFGYCLFNRLFEFIIKYYVYILLTLFYLKSKIQRLFPHGQINFTPNLIIFNGRAYSSRPVYMYCRISCSKQVNTYFHMFYHIPLFILTYLHRIIPKSKQTILILK